MYLAKIRWCDIIINDELIKTMHESCIINDELIKTMHESCIKSEIQDTHIYTHNSSIINFKGISKWFVSIINFKGISKWFVLIVELRVVTWLSFLRGNIFLFQWFTVASLHPTANSINASASANMWNFLFYSPSGV